MRLLLIEDDVYLSHSLKRSLMEEGYAVDAVFDGEEGEAYAEMELYDVIILDILLPGKDGIAVCRSLRQRRLTTPILMLTARDAVGDRVRGLDSGADDYLVKPFSLEELFARVRALLRRNAPNKESILQIGDLVMNPATREVERAGFPIKLNAKEFALLEYFMRHPRQVLTRTMIENHVWNYEVSNTSNVVDVYILRLRRKIDGPFPDKLLETIHNVGYRLQMP